MRGRGLKPAGNVPAGCPEEVAPHAGAWIETSAPDGDRKANLSPPMRGRGLKPSEYEQGHIPGATLIPLPELGDRLHELDPNKTQLVY